MDHSKELNWDSTLKNKSLSHGGSFLHMCSLERRCWLALFSEANPITARNVLNFPLEIDLTETGLSAHETRS